MHVLVRRNNGLVPHWRLYGILACLVVLLIVGCSADATAQEGIDAAIRPDAKSTNTQPNIIFILTDDLDYASAYRLPSINSLLREQGADLDDTFISYPLCCPTRATILTGLYTHNHGVRDNTPPDWGFQKFYSEGLEEKTIAVRLQQRGYKTALFGKYLNSFPGNTVRATYVPPGWEEWYNKQDVSSMYNYRIGENGHSTDYGSKTEDYYTDVLSRQVVDFVQRTAADSKPFFMYVAPTAPHRPAVPAERHKNAFADERAPRIPSLYEEDLSDKPSQIRNKQLPLFVHPIISATISSIEELQRAQIYRERLRSMLAVDDMVTSLVQKLKDVGKLDDTFIFFTSDNGFLWGEHRSYGKVLPYEESAHVPLFVRGPGVPAGSKVDKLVLNTDFASTFADLAGISFPADGRSFAPLLRGEELPWRSSILLEATEEGDQEEGGQGESSNTVPYDAVRTETQKYTEYANGERELYDLQADPYELDNIYSSAGSSLLSGLKTRLDVLKSCAGAGCQEAEDRSAG